MKRVTILLIICCLVAAGCAKPNKVIIEQLNNSDSIAVNYFKGDGSMDTVAAVKIVRNKQSINELAKLIGAKTKPVKTGCGYDGSLHFFKKNQVVQDVYFRISSSDDNCRLFTFTSLGEAQATAVSNEAKLLLESFRQR